MARTTVRAIVVAAVGAHVPYVWLDDAREGARGGFIREMVTIFGGPMRASLIV